MTLWMILYLFTWNWTHCKTHRLEQKLREDPDTREGGGGGGGRGGGGDTFSKTDKPADLCPHC